MSTWTALIDAPRDELLELERLHERWATLLLQENHPEILIAEKIVRLRLQIRRRSIDLE